jgi:hypothetical protein
MTKKERYTNQYTTMCNLIEAIWLKKDDKDYYNIDLENLPSMTSPQVRTSALFIMQTVS